jgi:hypothetical protein
MKKRKKKKRRRKEGKVEEILRISSF